MVSIYLQIETMACAYVIRSMQLVFSYWLFQKRLAVLIEGNPLDLLCNNVNCLGAFTALLDLELDFLTFRERTKAGAANGAEVNKNVTRSIILRDKTKAL